MQNAPPLPPPSFSAQVELCCNVTTMLLKLHQRQLAGTARSREVLLALRRRVRPRLQALKDVMGYNLAGVGVLRRMLEEERQAAVASL